jgi:hypothetical protein
MPVMYELYIQLDKIEFPIWRRFRVPAACHLDQLHDIIQQAMGWKDEHLHEFVVGQRRFTAFPLEDDLTDYEDESTVLLSDLLQRESDSLRYIYDFGDDWSHILRLDRIIPAPIENETDIRCLDGSGAYPPEDIGGAFTYYEFLEALDPLHRLHKEARRWLARDYDAEKVSLVAANRRLARFRR